MKTNKNLVTHCITALLERWGYVWGEWGRILNETILQQKISQYPKKFTSYKIAYIRKYYMGRRTADCGGVIKSFLWWTDSGPVYQPATDVNVDTMIAQATEKGTIDTIPEIPGLIVWHKGHVGVYIGNGKVIESRGTIYGVVQTELNKRPWTHWFKHKNITYIQESENALPLPAPWAVKPQKFVYEKGISDGLRPGDYPMRQEVWAMIYNYNKYLENK
jgi:hypothetical protein